MPSETSTANTSRSRGGVDICAQTCGRIDRGRPTGLPVAPIRLRRRERTDGPRTPTDLREDPRTRNDVQDADESLASLISGRTCSARKLKPGRAGSVLVATSPRRCDQPTAADRPGTRQNQRPLDDPRHHVKPRAGIRDHTSAAEQYHHQPTRQDCLLDGSPGIAPRTGGRIGQTGPRWRDDLDLIDTHPPAG